MKNQNQSKLAKVIGKSEAFVSHLLSGKRRPNWQTAKLLAAATGTSEALWLEGTPGQMRTALDKLKDA
jgi:transcriptional regulator with XRE-family HTH domain